MIETSGKTYCADMTVGLIIDEEIGRYLRSLFYLESGIKLQKPSRNSHVTIISQYEEPKKDIRIRAITLSIGFELFTNGNAYWVDVLSEESLELREELGVDKHPKFPLHFCIGYLKNVTNPRMF